MKQPIERIARAICCPSGRCRAAENSKVMKRTVFSCTSGQHREQAIAAVHAMRDIMLGDEGDRL